VGAVWEVVAGDGVMVLAVVAARVDVDLGRAEPRRGVQHRVADPLGDVVALGGGERAVHLDVRLGVERVPDPADPHRFDAGS